jgi:hypothetical protein
MGASSLAGIQAELAPMGRSCVSWMWHGILWVI